MKLSKKLLSGICFVLLFMNTQCDEDDIIEAPCGQLTVVDDGFYESAESDSFTLIDTQIVDNCLSVVFSASGCDGSSWSAVLVDSGGVAESLPEQRYLKLVFTNNETCLAVFEQERIFNLQPLQIPNSQEIILNIEGFPEPLTYSY